MNPDQLPSIPYESPNGHNLYDSWESGATVGYPPPLSVRDASYRSLIVSLIQELGAARTTLIGVGSGNGLVEAELQGLGRNVLATDCADSAVRLCAHKGLKSRRFSLLEDEPFEQFDVIYCDGVLGHLWQPRVQCVPAWNAIAQLGNRNSLAVVSNDLADGDGAAAFAVHDSPVARFYRPPSGSYAADAAATGKWLTESSSIYEYERRGTLRRREILVMRLLMDDWIEPEYLF
jgi:hypothetical protein